MGCDPVVENHYPAAHHHALFLCWWYRQHWSAPWNYLVHCSTVPLPLKYELRCGISITWCSMILMHRQDQVKNMKDCFLKPWLWKRHLTDLEGSSVCSFPLVIAGGFQDSDWRRISFLHGYGHWDSPSLDSVCCENSSLLRRVFVWYTFYLSWRVRVDAFWLFMRLLWMNPALLFIYDPACVSSHIHGLAPTTDIVLIVL